MTPLEPHKEIHMNKISGSPSMAFDNISTDVYAPAPRTADVPSAPRGEAFSDGVEFSAASRWGGGGFDGFLDITFGADKKLPEGGSSTTTCPKGTDPVVTTDKDGTVHIKCVKPSTPPQTPPILD
jgi:hypothetical protein